MKSLPFLLIQILSLLFVSPAIGQECIKYPFTKCSSYVDYSVPSSLDFKRIEQEFSQLSMLELIKTSNPDCYEAFSGYACFEAFPKCSQGQNGTQIQYVCKQTCLEAFTKCEKVFIQFGQSSKLPQCQGKNVLGFDYPLTNCLDLSLKPKSSTNTSNATITTSTLSANTFFIASPNPNKQLLNCDPETNLCVPCPAIDYLYPKGEIYQIAKQATAIGFTSTILSFITLLGFFFHPSYKKLPLRCLFWATLSVFMICILNSWPLFVDETGIKRLSCVNEVEGIDANNSPMCAIKTFLSVFFIVGANSWCLFFMISIWSNVCKRKSWIEDSNMITHLCVWVPSVIMASVVVGTNEVGPVPGFICYPAGTKAAPGFFYYLQTQSAFSVFFFFWALIYVIYITMRATTIVSDSDEAMAARHRLKMFLRPILLSLSVTAINIIHNNFFLDTFGPLFSAVKSRPSWVSQWQVCMLTESQNICAEKIKDFVPSAQSMRIYTSIITAIGFIPFITYGMFPHLYIGAFKEIRSKWKNRGQDSSNSTKHSSLASLFSLRTDTAIDTRGRKSESTLLDLRITHVIEDNIAEPTGKSEK